jgi:hypothetical protein
VHVFIQVIKWIIGSWPSLLFTYAGLAYSVFLLILPKIVVPSKYFPSISCYLRKLVYRGPERSILVTLLWWQQKWITAKHKIIFLPVGCTIYMISVCTNDHNLSQHGHTMAEHFVHGYMWLK